MKLFVFLLFAAAWSQAEADVIERSARQLEERLIAPCCWRQPLSMHDSEPARILKEEIRRELASGKTEEEILKAYEARYGIQILAEPPAVGFHRVLYIVPVLALSAGVFLLSALLTAWRRRAKEGSEKPMPTPEILEQIERDLNRESLVSASRQEEAQGGESRSSPEK